MVTMQAAEIGAAGMIRAEMYIQSLEINLDWMRNLKASWENSLREVAMHCVTKTE